MATKDVRWTIKTSRELYDRLRAAAARDARTLKAQTGKVLDAGLKAMKS